jgi:hypothetical protein
MESLNLFIIFDDLIFFFFLFNKIRKSFRKKQIFYKICHFFENKIFIKINRSYPETEFTAFENFYLETIHHFIKKILRYVDFSKAYKINNLHNILFKRSEDELFPLIA